MSPSGSALSLQDRLRQSLKPLGGELRIDAFIEMMARERARRAADQAAAEEAARGAETAAIRRRAPKAAPPAAAGGDLQDEVKAFMQRDEVGDAPKDEVSDFMEFLGDTGFDPTTMGD